MNEDLILSKVIDLLENYIGDQTRPKEVINKYNNIIVSEDFPWDSINLKIQALDKFQDELSMFVENPDWRTEHEGYFGEKELKEKIKKFLDYLKNE